MLNIAKLKIILFDFDDTLCIHTDHKSGGDEEYNAKMVVGDMSAWKDCQVNEQMALFMSICEEKGIRMGIISTTESFRHMESKQQFIKRMYGVNLENFCVGTQDGKLDMLNAIAAAYVYEKDEIAIVDDYWYQLERAADAGFQAYSPMQIVNYVNSDVHKKELKRL